MKLINTPPARATNTNTKRFGTAVPGKAIPNIAHHSSRSAATIVGDSKTNANTHNTAAAYKIITPAAVEGAIPFANRSVSTQYIPNITNPNPAKLAPSKIASPFKICAGPIANNNPTPPTTNPIHPFHPTFARIGGSALNNNADAGNNADIKVANPDPINCSPAGTNVHVDAIPTTANNNIARDFLNAGPKACFVTTQKSKIPAAAIVARHAPSVIGGNAATSIFDNNTAPAQRVDIVNNNPTSTTRFKPPVYPPQPATSSSFPNRTSRRYTCNV